MKQGMFICDLMTLRPVSMDKNFADLFETTNDIIMNDPRKLLPLICNGNLEKLQQLHSLLLTKGSFYNETLCIELRGTKKYFSCTATVEGQFITGYIKNITEQTQAETSLTKETTWKN